MWAIAWTTFQRLLGCAGFSNFWNTTPLSSTGAVMARDTSKLFVSNNPTYGMWWEKFLSGMHNRMGDDVRPDLAISLKVMGAMLRFMELDYNEAIGRREKDKIAAFAMFSIAGYLGGFKGRGDSEIGFVWFVCVFC